GTLNGTYRGDSWICAAAIHAGVLSNSGGGCLVAELNPSAAGETYSATTRNGISSFAFNSSYPFSLTFQSIATGQSGYCQDLGFYAEGFFLPMLMLLPFLTVTRKHMFWSTLVWAYLFWVFVSPDTGKGNSDIQHSLASLLPALATLYVIYWQIAKFALPKPSQFPVEMSILFVGMVWFGFHLDMLSNTTIPIYSVSAKLFSNPATFVPLVCVLVVIGLAVLAFAYMHFKQATLLSYVVGYPAVCLVYAILPHVIGLSIHLHHYLYGLLLLPITRLKSRVSVVSLGLLLGLFTQGVLKYGFASPFDTSLQANAIYTQATVQTQWSMTSADISQGMIRWVYPFNQTANITDLYTVDLQQELGLSPTQLANQMTINEYIMTINDVQVYRAKKARFSMVESLNTTNANMDPIGQVFRDYATVDREFYIRVAPVSFGNVQGYGDVAVPANDCILSPFINTPTRPWLRINLASLLDNPQHSEELLTFQANTAIHAHAAILCLHSTWFPRTIPSSDARTTPQRVVCESGDTSAETGRLVPRFLYTLKVDVPELRVLEVMRFAWVLGVQRLVEICVEAFERRLLTPETCVAYASEEGGGRKLLERGDFVDVGVLEYQAFSTLLDNDEESDD
ncbi:hypothetical protein HDU98_004488, partial [Podochytrium sp. JEL0797]